MDKLSLTKGMWLQQNEGDPTRPSGRIETLSSIIGPCIYFQSIMPYVSQLRICHDVIITCRKQADGFRTFANCIVSNYEEVLQGQMAFVHGIYVIQKSRSGGKGIPKLWYLNAIQQDKNEFVGQREAVRSKQEIYMDLIVWLPIDQGKISENSVSAITEDFGTSMNESIPEQGGYYKVRKHPSCIITIKWIPNQKRSHLHPARISHSLSVYFRAGKMLNVTHNFLICQNQVVESQS